jgi:hypothetical protein
LSRLGVSWILVGPADEGVGGLQVGPPLIAGLCAVRGFRSPALGPLRLAAFWSLFSRNDRLSRRALGDLAEDWIPRKCESQRYVAAFCSAECRPCWPLAHPKAKAS